MDKCSIKMEREKWPLNAEVAETPSSDTGSKCWPSGHDAATRQRLLYPQANMTNAGARRLAFRRFKSSGAAIEMSAKCQMADIAFYSMTSSARASSDAGTVRPRAFAALRLTNKRELGRLLDRQIAGLGALEDLVHVNRGAPMHVLVARPKRHQPAGLDQFPVRH